MVVLLVSVIAYFTAYALKGNDLKINKIYLVDFDLRSDLDDKLQTRKAYATGTTWFTAISSLRTSSSIRTATRWSPTSASHGP